MDGHRVAVGLGLAAQRAAIDTECTRRGWALVAIYRDALSGKNILRPVLTSALAAVESGAASDEPRHLVTCPMALRQDLGDRR